MKVTIFGSGYVGLVTGACLAEVGNEVLCVDNDARKVAMLRQGRLPIYEPDLDGLIARNMAAGRIRFTTEVAEGVGHGVLQFIAVGTPPDEDGAADLRHVLEVARDIARYMDCYRIIIDKSTVPVGSADMVRRQISATLAERGGGPDFAVVSNPEFLKEGAAVNDFMKPDRIVLGADNAAAQAALVKLYAPFNRNHDRIINMDIRSAELTKYAANAMLATKISFMNELANMAEALGADIEHVRRGIGADRRIGYAYIYPGCGYGGSCLPKDVAALQRSAEQSGYRAELLGAVLQVNRRQKLRVFEKMAAHFGGGSDGAGLRGKTIAVWGLAFKPNTDDMREAPSRTLIEALWRAGATVRAHDPAAVAVMRELYGTREDLVITNDHYDAVDGAHALAVLTEWQVYRSPDLAALTRRMADKTIFDGRNMYDPRHLREQGFTYYGIGRPAA